MRSFGVLSAIRPMPSSPRRRRVRRPPPVPRGTSAITSPVAGLSTSIVSPLDDSTHSPPTNFLCWVTDTLT